MVKVLEISGPEFNLWNPQREVERLSSSELSSLDRDMSKVNTHTHTHMHTFPEIQFSKGV